MIPGLGFIARVPASSADLSVSLTSSPTDGSILSTYTFSAQSIGAAESTRYVVVAVMLYTSGAATTVNSVTLNGSPMTLIEQLGTTVAGQPRVAFFGLAVPSGSVADFVVTCSDSVTRMGLGIFRVIGNASPNIAVVAANGSGNPLSLNIPVSSGGALIAAVQMANNAVAGQSYTLSGITERFDIAIGGASYIAGGCDNVTITETRAISATLSTAPNTTGKLCALFLS